MEEINEVIVTMFVVFEIEYKGFIQIQIYLTNLKRNEAIFFQKASHPNILNPIKAPAIFLHRKNFIKEN
jgi:hypothetical protein